MRTQIIRLDGYDDVTSARDKIGMQAARRVLLVWPRDSQPLRRKMDLVLLQRRVRDLGGQLALVPRSREVGAIGREIGLPVFSSVARAERARWRADRKQAPAGRPGKSFSDLQQERSAREEPASRFSSPWARLVVFTLGVLAVFALAGFLLPGAEIHFVPPSQTQTLTWGGEALPAGGAVPLRSVNLVVEASGQIQTTGLIRVADQSATGTALFTNLTDAPVDIPTGTVIASGQQPAVRFATLEDTSLAGGAGETSQVKVQALVPGPAGNVGLDTLQAIEGPLSGQAAVTNPLPMTGGTDRSLPAPDEADRTALKKELLGQLETAALAQVQAQLGEGAFLVKDSVSSPEILSGESSPPDQAPSGSLKETLRARYAVKYLARNDLRVAVQGVMDASLPAGFQPSGSQPPVIEKTSAAINPDGSASWGVTASRRIERAIPNQAVSLLILGKPIARVPAILKAAFNLPEDPVIKSYPSFWPWIPFLAIRIQYF